MSGRDSPPVTDSDIMYLAIKRLERVAEKMMKLEYDDELDRLMNAADEWFSWAAYNMNRRNGVAVPEGDDDVDPFERAAIIAETLQGGDGKPANAEQIAQALRAWVRHSKAQQSTVSETGTAAKEVFNDAEPV